MFKMYEQCKVISQVVSTGQFKWNNEDDYEIIDIHALKGNPKFQALVEIYEHEHLLDQFDIMILLEQLLNCLTDEQKTNFFKNFLGVDLTQ